MNSILGRTAMNRFGIAAGLMAIALIAMTVLIVADKGSSSQPTARADHNEFPNEQFCETVFTFFNAVCPDEFHGAFHGDKDYVNQDELGPLCFYATDGFTPILEPGHAIWGEAKGPITPNGNMNVRCEFDVPEEIIAQPISEAVVYPGRVCYGPLGPTNNTLHVLTPAGKIIMTCHFQYGK